MACVIGTAIEDRGLQPAILGRNQHIGTQLVNYIDHRTQISCKWSGVTGSCAKLTHFARKRTVYSDGAVDFKIGFQFEFHLRPSPHRIQSSKNCGRIAKRTVEQYSLADGAAKTTCAPASIERAGKLKSFSDWKHNIRRARPPVKGSVESPVLAPVVSSHARRKILPERAMTPRNSSRVNRLAGLFTPGWIARSARIRKIPGNGIENSSLQRKIGRVGKDDPVFDANLRRPCPQISRVRKCRIRQRGKRRGRKRSKK